MTAPLKTPVALAFCGAALVAAFTGPALAERGPDGEGRGAILLEMFNSADSDGNGLLSPEELAAHRLAMFTAVDANGDGALDAAEMTAYQTAQMADRMADRAARMIADRDDNGDGSLTPDEMGEGPVERMFARIDSDDDGAISKAEAEAARDHMQKRRRMGHDG